MKLFLKNLLFTLLVPGTVAVVGPLLLRGRRPVVAGPWLGFGVVALAAGAGIYLWSVRGFAVIGRGTPLPVDAPRRLVARGPYRLTRNPMYVGVLTVICGWSILFRDVRLVAYGLVVGVVFHLFIVLYEEPHLRRQFGSEYEDYAARVGRWLPRPAPRDAR